MFRGEHRSRISSSVGAGGDAVEAAALLGYHSEDEEIPSLHPKKRVQLRQRGQSQDPPPKSLADPFRRYEIINHDVQPGETLAGISLKYNVQLSLLKQCNGIAKETHLFAHRTIKVPVPRNSVIVGDLVDISNKVTIEREGPPNEDVCPRNYLQGLDEKVRQIESAQHAAGERLNMLTPTLPTSSLPPIVTTSSQSNNNKVLITNWCLVLSCLLVVCVGVPVFYTLYILFSPFHADIFQLAEAEMNQSNRGIPNTSSSGG